MDKQKDLFYKTVRRFPSRFWVIVLSRFADDIGNTLLFPFFALFITDKFNVGMTQAGVMLGMSSLASLVGSLLGGALADRFGRRNIILFGLTFSGLSSISLGLINDLPVMYIAAILVGLLGNIGQPAHEAMVADVLPPEKRQEGFGILRVGRNMAWLIGPTIGGLMGSRSFLALFLADAIMSCIAAGIVYLLLPESKPQRVSKEHTSSMGAMLDYHLPLQDTAFMAFIITSILMATVYQQMYSSLPVFLRDQHGVGPQGYGLLLSISGMTVVLLQFWVINHVKRLPSFLMMSAGALFYTLGFSFFGVGAQFAFFAMNIVIITFGEMIIMPVSQALTASFAPEEMRGRYLAIAGMTWTIPSIVGPGLGGYVLDHFNPDLLWYIGGVLCIVSAFSFYCLHLRIGAREQFIVQNEERQPVKKEEGLWSGTDPCGESEIGLESRRSELREHL